MKIVKISELSKKRFSTLPLHSHTFAPLMYNEEPAPEPFPPPVACGDEMLTHVRSCGLLGRRKRSKVLGGEKLFAENERFFLKVYKN